MHTLSIHISKEGLFLLSAWQLRSYKSSFKFNGAAQTPLAWKSEYREKQLQHRSKSTLFTTHFVCTVSVQWLYTSLPEYNVALCTFFFILIWFFHHWSHRRTNENEYNVLLISIAFNSEHAIHCHRKKKTVQYLYRACFTHVINGTPVTRMNSLDVLIYCTKSNLDRCLEALAMTCTVYCNGQLL